VRVDGKNVLLTAALGSLGRAQALRLAAAGARTFLLDRPGHQNGDLSAAQDVVRALAERAGAVDILINNAALIINRPFTEFLIAEYEEEMRVNAAAGFAVAQAVAPGMIAKNYGKIVNFFGDVERYDRRLCPLCRLKRRALRLDEDAGARARPAWNTRQCGEPRRRAPGSRRSRVRRPASAIQTTGCSIGNRSKNACNPSMWPIWRCFFARRARHDHQPKYRD
jgi:short chain dehydrogenase